LKEIKALLKKERADRKVQRNFKPSPDNYFWTHGYKVANSHTTQSCNYPKHGQNREATKADNMRGSHANKEQCVGVPYLNISEKFKDCSTPPMLDHHETAIVDSGCTGQFLLINAHCENKVKYQNPLRVCLPNGDTMDSTQTASLEIPELSQASSIAHVFPGMENHYLLSVRQLCKEGYYITFSIVGVTIYNSTEKAGLWHINLRHEKPQHTISVASNVYELGNTAELFNYLHKAMFSPTKSVLLQAVNNGHLTTWDGLTEQAINKHLKITPTTAMRHMNQRRQNICSTTKSSIASDIED
jgi:hypothetical protein